MSIPSGTPNLSDPPPPQTIPYTGPKRAAPHTPQLPSASSNTPSHSIAIRSSASPIPLTAPQEAEIADLYHSNIRSYCQPSIAAFAKCATGRTVSVSWACRAERKEMNKCMLKHAGREEEDRAREEWFRTLPERAERKKQEKDWEDNERRKRREWWGQDPETGRRLTEEELALRRKEGVQGAVLPEFVEQRGREVRYDGSGRRI